MENKKPVMNAKQKDTQIKLHKSRFFSINKIKKSIIFLGSQLKIKETSTKHSF